MDSTNPANPPEPPASVGVLFSRFSDQISTLIRGEFELAGAKVKRMGMRMGIGGALLAVAGVLALFGLSWLLYTIYLAVAIALPKWAAALIVTGVLFLLVAILAGVGAVALKRGKGDVPAPKDGMKKNLDAIKAGIMKDAEGELK